VAEDQELSDQEQPKTDGKLDTGPLKVGLRKPIMANGAEVSELTFREPTGGDIERAGNPVIVDVFSGDTVKITFDEKKMTQMMSRLAEVPPSSIRLLHPKDWNTIAWQLVHFFTPDL
jgi:hypothetical protein